MSWLYLILAILFEVAGTTSMKLSEGFAKLAPTIGMIVCYCITFTFLTLAMRKIDLSVAYTVWAGIGSTLIAIVGVFYFGEQATALRIASIALVILGVVGLKLSTS